MSPFIFNLAMVWLAILVAVNVVLVVSTRSIATRILASDTLTLLLVALLTLFAFNSVSAYYLDAALILALLSFVGVLTVARYYGDGRPF